MLRPSSCGIGNWYVIMQYTLLAPDEPFIRTVGFVTITLSLYISPQSQNDKHHTSEVKKNKK